MNKPKIIQIIDVVSNAIAGNRIDEDFIKSCIYGKVDAELLKFPELFIMDRNTGPECISPRLFPSFG